MRTAEKSTEELLQELISYQKKEVRSSRAAALISLVLVLAVLAAMFVLAPRVLRLANEAEKAIRDVNGLTASAQELIGNANTVLTENTDAVNETIRKLNEVDFDTLNQAIHNLDDAVRPLAELARKLGG